MIEIITSTASFAILFLITLSCFKFPCLLLVSSFDSDTLTQRNGTILDLVQNTFRNFLECGFNSVVLF